MAAAACRYCPLAFDAFGFLLRAGSGRQRGQNAQRTILACKRERARRQHIVSLAELSKLAKTEPSVLVVNEEDMARALASALA